VPEFGQRFGHLHSQSVQLEIVVVAIFREEFLTTLRDP
jgi:hypothetical protein